MPWTRKSRSAPSKQTSTSSEKKHCWWPTMRNSSGRFWKPGGKSAGERAASRAAGLFPTGSPRNFSRRYQAAISVRSWATSSLVRAKCVAAEHAGATAKIWRRLEEELQKEGLSSLEEIDLWLEQRKKREPVKYEYRLDRIKRLELPDRPGVYRMLSKEGKVLMGKATSLKSRVNSYFRGQKGRDRKKLEMLAQVWDIEVTECSSPLEAALLENEEIKRLGSALQREPAHRAPQACFLLQRLAGSEPAAGRVIRWDPFRYRMRSSSLLPG